MGQGDERRRGEGHHLLLVAIACPDQLLVAGIEVVPDKRSISSRRIVMVWSPVASLRHALISPPSCGDHLRVIGQLPVIELL
jgi:hypothetical protein